MGFTLFQNSYFVVICQNDDLKIKEDRHLRMKEDRTFKKCGATPLAKYM
jgi:hypothetical protein